MLLASLAFAVLLLIVILSIRCSQQDPQLHFQNGMAAARNGDSEAVVEEARILFETPGFEDHARMILGTFFLETREYPAAAAEFQLVKDNPNLRIEALIRSGEACYRMQRFVDAEQLFLVALEQDESNSDARRWLASTYYDLGAMELALKHLKIVGETNPEDGRPFRLRGRIGKDFQHYGEAINDYREALNRNLPQTERDAVKEELAECLVKHLQFTEALDELENAKPSAHVYSLQSACYAALGDSPQAIRKADEALHLNPTLVSAIVTKASIELEAGNPENVIGMLEDAATAQPGDFEILFLLTKALRQAGRISEADEKSIRLGELERLVDEFARLNAIAFRDLENAPLRLQLGKLANQMSRPDLARIWLEAALAIDPNLVEAKQLLTDIRQQ